MNIIFFAHPSFSGSQSMPRFAGMLVEGMRERGHKAELWRPCAFFYKLRAPGSIRKWFGYIDQYIIFPFYVHRKIESLPPETLFVFTDHALGPWVPLVKNRVNVIHCHDFLAQNSALGRIKEHRSSFTGKLYQKFIHRGYSKGKHFISISKKSRDDLEKILPFKPSSSEVVSNGLNREFKRQNPENARKILSGELRVDLLPGYVLHVGGNQWYKNRTGVIEIYNTWRTIYNNPLPLLLIGEKPSKELFSLYRNSQYKEDIYIITKKNDDFVQLVYSGASVLLFPSLAEGFGSPIAEAMASGCPVITTNEAPMTEVAGDAAFLIPKSPSTKQKKIAWLNQSALILNEVVEMNPVAREDIIIKGIINAKRFDPKLLLDRIEQIYQNIIGEG